MEANKTEGVERGRMRVQGFSEPEMEFQLLRGLGAGCYGGSTVGELLVAANQTRELMAAQSDADRDPAACWVKAHAQMAQRVEARGREALGKGHHVSALDHLLRASMYYRAAEYFCDPYTPEHRHWGLASRECFIEGARHLDTPVEVLRIPYDDAESPAFFFRPDTRDILRKTLLVNTGFD